MAAVLVGLVLGTSCGGGGGSGQVGFPGQVLTREDGRPYFVDPNESGVGQDLRLLDVFWGRLVDVFDVDEEGNTRARPIFSDFVIDQNVPSNGQEYTLETNPITQGQRLIIHRPYSATEIGGSSFIALLRNAESGLPVVLAKNDDGSSAAPFSLVARNACLVLRFSDLLDDAPEVEEIVAELVKLATGYPPSSPFAGRILFDPNHGGPAGGRFHSTRVLYDLTISDAEAASIPALIPVNSFGLPASRLGSFLPNASLRIPTRVDFASGQFELLHNLRGAPLSPFTNGPRDALAPTEDIVRAMRSGNATDINSGFLLDLEPPQIVGSWSTFLSEVREFPGDPSEFSLLATLTFLGPCQKRPLQGEVFTIGQHFFRVADNATAPDFDGAVTDVHLEPLGNELPSNLSSLEGNGFYRPVYAPEVDVENGCWISISPQPGVPPLRDVAANMQAALHFSEPMEPNSIIPLENFQMLRGAPGIPARWNNVVVGTVGASDDLREFRFTPSLPLAHNQDSREYHFLFNNMTDLSGNPLVAQPPFARLTVDPLEAPHENSGVSFFFDTTNEIDPDGTGNDLRGQFFYDFPRGEIRPRPVITAAAVADRLNPVPGIMIPFAPGVQTPLSPLGSKLQTMWRYVDFAWQVLDESLYNLDVIGLNWAPVEGQVIADFYANFEMRVSHTQRLPVECREVQYGLPLFPGSGLRNNLFTDNVLSGQGLSQKVVHERQLGYSINPVDLFVSSSGRTMMPFPWNRGRSVAELVTYTWRDTRSNALGGPGSRGLPLCIEIGTPLFLENGPPRRVRSENDVPTFGLPILMEFRCFPSDSGVGLNAFDISLASNSSIFPYFRTFSTGGINRFGNPVQVQPDLEDSPMGGFNPSSSPPGRRTPNADPSFYIGQLDYVVRISHVHTAWIDARPSPAFSKSIDYATPVVLPPPADQPPGTQAILEFRGADALIDMGDAGFDAGQVDIYGRVFEIQSENDGCNQCIRTNGVVLYHQNVESWTTDIDSIDGASFFQARVTFLNNIESKQVARLAALGFPFRFDG